MRDTLYKTIPAQNGPKREKQREILINTKPFQFPQARTLSLKAWDGAKRSVSTCSEYSERPLLKSLKKICCQLLSTINVLEVSDEKILMGKYFRIGSFYYFNCLMSGD